MPKSRKTRKTRKQKIARQRKAAAIKGPGDVMVVLPIKVGPDYGLPQYNFILPAASPAPGLWNPSLRNVTILRGPHHGRIFQVTPTQDTLTLPQTPSLGPQGLTAITDPMPSPTIPTVTMTITPHEDLGWVCIWPTKEGTPPQLCPACGKGPVHYTVVPISFTYHLHCPDHGPWIVKAQDFEAYHKLTGDDPTKTLVYVKNLADTSAAGEYAAKMAGGVDTPTWKFVTEQVSTGTLSIATLNDLIQKYYKKSITDALYSQSYYSTPKVASLSGILEELEGLPERNAASVTMDKVVQYAIAHGILVPEQQMEDDDDMARTHDEIMDMLDDPDLYTPEQLAAEAAKFDATIDAVLEQPQTQASANALLDKAFGWIQEVDDALAEDATVPVADDTAGAD